MRLIKLTQFNQKHLLMMKNTKIITALLLLITTLSGCVSYSPTDPRIIALRGKKLYAQVNSYFTSIEHACHNEQNAGSPYCDDKAQYVWTGALIGQHAYGTLQKTSMAVPKSAGVEKGDIIEYHLSDSHPWGVFDRIAAKSADETSSSSCRWDGSHFWSGGVICNGWKWDRDYPFLGD